ncbi:hypothetical protein ACFXQA_14560 [Microbacterium sp. P07]|uniref:hypothetical protein n=1 Tax=Microbacterium sp. P07 TaxID=3366952 RepID=UPI0037473C38
MTSPTARTLGSAAAAALAAVIWLSPTTAVAQPITENTDVTVSVPAATPTAEPSTTPNPTNVPESTDTTGATAPGGNPGVAPGGSSGTGGAATGVESPAGGATTSAPCVPKEPAVPTVPTTGGGDATVDKDVYVIGDSVTATAAGFGPGEQVQLVLFSEPALVGTFAADTTGAVTAQFAIAEETLAGSHTLQFTGWCGAISAVDVLVGSTNGASSAGPQGVPFWAWWIGGGLGLLLLVAAAWWAIRTMRMPDTGPEVVTA